MAICPSCKKEWQWDWEQDTFRTPEGEECEQAPTVVVRKMPRVAKKSDDHQMVYRCSCGLILGVMSDWDGMLEDKEPKEWRRYTWEEPENYYDSTA